MVRHVILNGEDREVLNKKVTFEQRLGKNEGMKLSKGIFQEKGKIKT